MRFTFGILLLSYAITYAAADLQSDLIKDQIVSDVIDKAPNELLRVTYNNKQVNYGENWTPTSMIPTPNVEWNGNPNSYYTLISSDPDAPSRAKPTYRSCLLWLVTNIPGSDLSKGETIVEYVGAGPLIDGGIQRVLFTVYEQPGKLTFDERHVPNRAVDFRLWWSERVFTSKYKLGDPIAAMLLFSQYDDYVPILFQEFMDYLSES